MEDSLQPEERLLKLIRGEKKTPHAAKKTAAAGEIPVVLKKPRFDLARFKFGHAFKRNAVIGIAALPVIYLVISLVYPLFLSGPVKLPSVQKDDVSSVPGKEAEINTKPFEFYANGIKDKRVFGYSNVGPVKVLAPVGDTNLIKDTSLVGVIFSNPPQAVLEDKKNQKTYYLSEGQFIGKFRVEKIREGKVVLEYKGEKYELSL